ncbi:MAG: peptidyl-prolyl cis-trans isomerase [Spirochaetales bacterium]|nr:peptidyl-prolyl cis-trans isomerase [Spirochaetales bacterium]
MKKITGIILFLLIFLCQVYAEVIDVPVVRVKLTSTELVYQSEFKAIIEGMEAKMKRPLSVEEKKVILDKLIEEKILVQAATSENITVTQSEIDAKIKQIKQLLELQEGRKYTDAEFKVRVLKQSSGTSWDEFLVQIKNSVLQEKYLVQKKGDKFSKVDKPTNTEINDYYKKNRRVFITPEMIKFKQIFILTKGVSSDVKKSYSQRADEIYKDLLQGGSFDNYSEVYVKGSDAKIGSIYIETWQIEEESLKVTYGEDFFDKIFKLDEGAVSNVLESNVGLHIIKIIKKFPFKTLTLDDKIPPQLVTTVREKIEAALKQQKEMAAYQAAYTELLDELKKKADIKIYEENLTW